MSSLKNLCRVGQMTVRQMSAKSAAKAAPAAEEELPKGLISSFYKLKGDQKLYQKPDGIPIHLKRGLRDKVLMYITVGLLGVGLVGCADFVYHLP